MEELKWREIGKMEERVEMGSSEVDAYGRRMHARDFVVCLRVLRSGLAS